MFVVSISSSEIRNEKDANKLLVQLVLFGFLYVLNVGFSFLSLVFHYQVTDHLKAVAVGTDIRVVPIVGGMSTEKQERLLRMRPEVVVGTPGRLWELMSGGEKHLVEVSTS